MNKHYETLASMIKEYCGIDFLLNISNLEMKMVSRLKLLNLSIEEYLFYLKKNPLEWDKLVECVTINETYFFREEHQLEEFQQLLAQKKSDIITLWCIPCSTGEEAYSLAILAKEAEKKTGKKVKIYACDINKKVLETAKKGYYTKNSLSFRRFPYEKNYLKTYFTEDEKGYQIKDEIKQMITFEPFNLKDSASYNKYRNVDFIFCRNVLFYFNEPIVEQIINNFYRTLHQDGVMFLGHAESISNLKTNFQTHYTQQTFYYKKGV